MSDRIAFIGTGLMGAPMVARLLAAGFPVRIWNRSLEKMQPLIGLGALAAASPAAAVVDAQTVCLCLTDADAVADVLFGPDGLAEAMTVDAILVDFSTIGPNATRALAARLRAVRPSVRWVDAPVSGGVRGAETGELVVMCGGDKAAVAVARPVLAQLAKRVCHLGALGNGQAAKLCNQLIVATNIAAIAEALVLGRELGLDITDLPDALAGGWADSLPLQIVGSRMAAGVVDPPIVAMGTYVKDLGLVLDSAGRVPPLASLARAIHADAAKGSGGTADVAALIDWVGRDPA